MKNVQLFEEFINDSLTEAGVATNLNSENWHWIGDLRDKLKPSGFQEDPNPMKDPRFSLSKGNDYDGINIFVKTDTGDVEWTVVVGGQVKLSKKFKINYKDTANIGKQGAQVYAMIMKDITPYLKMQIRPIPEEG